MTDSAILNPGAFDAFYQAVYGYRPFRWQTELAADACRGQWPRFIKLPTSSGKTACLDIAVFALAHQASRHALESTPINAPRRIFFVVDRRVIVNEAFRRATWTAALLRKSLDAEATIPDDAARHFASLDHSQCEALSNVASWLRRLAGNDAAPPLDCFELRGGIYRDDAWSARCFNPRC